MLQDNITPRRAHLAHAAVVGLHAICCGLPALAMIAVAASGAASGVVLLSSFVSGVHGFLHSHEVWLIGVSAVFVGVGAALEIALRRSGAPRSFPWLFALSAGCLLLNIAILTAHRGV